MDSTRNLIQYKLFESFKKIVAFTTCKQTLKNKKARFTGDINSEIENNKAELAQILGINSEQFVFPQQTHTNSIAEISEIPNTEINNTDALITNRSGICLCIQTADCAPILLFDPIKNVVAVVHSGWRGTVKKIVQHTVQKMVSKYNSSPKNIIAAIGPSISPEVYEVGYEVLEKVKHTIPNSELTLSKNSTGKSHFNLWEANKQLLLDVGILNNNIEILAECSYQKNDMYFSARKEGIETGRMVTGIMLIH